jgi:hypothetical protein
MDKANSTEGVSGYGSGQGNETDASKTETTGDTSTTTADTTNTQGTSDTETKTGDESKQTETTEQKNVSGYSTENKVEEIAETKTETKTETKVEDLKIDNRGLADDQIKDIIEFAKETKLSNEQAQQLLDKRKSQLDKYNEDQSKFDAEVKATYTKWEGDLRTDWGNEFAANVHAVNNTLTKLFPETSKLLASSGKRLNPGQMKEIFNISKLLGDEGTFEAGGSNNNKTDRHPSDYYTN